MTTIMLTTYVMQCISRYCTTKWPGNKVARPLCCCEETPTFSSGADDCCSCTVVPCCCTLQACRPLPVLPQQCTPSGRLLAVPAPGWSKRCVACSEIRPMQRPATVCMHKTGRKAGRPGAVCCCSVGAVLAPAVGPPPPGRLGLQPSRTCSIHKGSSMCEASCDAASPFACHKHCGTVLSKFN